MILKTCNTGSVWLPYRKSRSVSRGTSRYLWMMNKRKCWYLSRIKFQGPSKTTRLQMQSAMKKQVSKKPMLENLEKKQEKVGVRHWAAMFCPYTYCSTQARNELTSYHWSKDDVQPRPKKDRCVIMGRNCTTKGIPSWPCKQLRTGLSINPQKCIFTVSHGLPHQFGRTKYWRDPDSKGHR